MNPELLSRMSLFLLLVVFIVNRAYYTNIHSHSEEDIGRARQINSPTNRLAGLLNLLALLAAAVYLVVPNWLAWAALPFPFWLRWIGVGLALFGFALLQWSHASLSRNWSDAPRLLRGQTLVTGGPYQWVRHPIYSAFLLILGAPLLITANWLVGLLWIVPTALDVASRIRFEEAILSEKFGNDYRLYMARTGRLLPRL